MDGVMQHKKNSRIMTRGFYDLGVILNEMYSNSKDGEAVAMIHLFAIKYAEGIKTSGESMVAIAKAGGIQESYGTEISKGVKLAKFVVPK